MNQNEVICTIRKPYIWPDEFHPLACMIDIFVKYALIKTSYMLSSIKGAIIFNLTFIQLCCQAINQVKLDHTSRPRLHIPVSEIRSTTCYSENCMLPVQRKHLLSDVKLSKSYGEECHSTACLRQKSVILYSYVFCSEINLMQL